MNQHDTPTQNYADLLAGHRGPILPTRRDPDSLFTTPEAAAYLGVSPKTLETWRCTGRHGLPYIRVGRLVRYRMRDLEEWLAARSQDHTGQAGE